jgi:catechol 2,3-dioxygenase-like lactoylglutathione lyase family enzyme
MWRGLCAFVLTLCVLAPCGRAGAQVVAPADAPIVYGHHHLNAGNIEEHKKFWVGVLGGTPMTFGPNKADVVKYPGVFLFMRAQAPTGPTKGTTVNHIGFSVPNLRQVLDKAKAGGYRIVTREEAPPNVTVVDDIGQVTGGAVSGIAFVMAPDSVKVELVEIKAQPQPIALHHVHFAGPQNKEMHAWYMKTFGAKPRQSANPNFVAAELPGVALNFSDSAQPVVGTKGRALDHIGFEVKNLEAFCKQLEAQGIKFDVPYRKIPDANIAIAFISDPWGTSIELTEGLDKIS